MLCRWTKLFQARAFLEFFEALRSTLLSGSNAIDFARNCLQVIYHDVLFFWWMKLLLGYGPKSSEFFHLNLYWTSSTSCGVIWRNNIVIVTHIQVQRHVSTVRRLTLKSRSQCVRTRTMLHLSSYYILVAKKDGFEGWLGLLRNLKYKDRFSRWFKKNNINEKLRINRMHGILENQVSDINPTRPSSKRENCTSVFNKKNGVLMPQPQIEVDTVSTPNVTDIWPWLELFYDTDCPL